MYITKIIYFYKISIDLLTHEVMKNGINEYFLKV